MSEDTASILDEMPLRLDDGLVLRWAREADAEALVAFNHLMHDEPPDVRDFVANWTRDLVGGQHPTVQISNFVLVEDPVTGTIVSSTVTIPQTWAYGGIRFAVGRPELVGTLPDYRRRGLVRKQFAAIHALGARRGELVQVITGVPWFYRQFGYGMALDLEGGRGIYAQHIPKLGDGDSEPYTVRLAETDAELSFVRELHDRRSAERLIATVRDDAQWHYDLRGRRRNAEPASRFYVIEDAAGKQLVGYARTSMRMGGPLVAVRSFELVDGLGPLAVLPGFMRQMLALGQAYLEEPKAKQPARDVYGVFFELGRAHPVYDAWQHDLLRVTRPYAWYVRVPDMIAFLTHIGPALERNLADSPAAGYSGELKLHWFTDGLRLAFERGKITVLEPWRPDHTWQGDAYFPDTSFLEVVFGRRRCAELRDVHADCICKGTAEILLDSLFPRFTGAVWGLT